MPENRLLLKQELKQGLNAAWGLFAGLLHCLVDCRGAVARVRDSYTDDPSSIPVRLVVASWG